MAKNKSLLEQSLPYIARLVGKKRGIKITVGGVDAFANPDQINIPALPNDERALTLARGYLDHEAGHHAHTDFAVRHPTAFGQCLLNVVEDVREERMVGREFPGAKTNLRRLLRELVAAGEVFPGLSEESVAAEALAAYVAASQRSKVLEQECVDPITEKARDILIAKGRGSLVQAIDRILRGVPRLKSTRDALGMVERMLEAIKEDEQPQPPQAEASGDADQDQGESSGDDAGEGDTESEQDADSDTGGDAQDGDPDQDQGESSGDDAGEGDTGSERDADSQPQSAHGAGGKIDLQEAVDSLDVGEIMRQKLDEEARDSGGHGEYPVTMAEEIDHWRLGEAYPEPADVRLASNALRRRMVTLIQSVRLDRSYAARSGNRMIGRRLTRAMVGDPRIFERSEHRKALNTAIRILVDASTSMAGTELYIAKQAAMAVSMAMEGLQGVEVGVTAFPAGRGADVWVVQRPGRTVGQDLVRWGFPSCGSTPMTQALWHQAAEIALAREPRKILMVVTDGGPDHAPSAQECVAAMRDHGIEVLGIGINTMAVEDLFPVHRVITDVAELPPVMFEMLTEKLAA